MVEEVHTPEEECLQRSVPRGFPTELPALLDLSRSSVVSSRLFAIRRLRERTEQEAWARIQELEREDPSASARRAAKRTLERRTRGSDQAEDSRD